MAVPPVGKGFMHLAGLQTASQAFQNLSVLKRWLGGVELQDLKGQVEGNSD